MPGLNEWFGEDGVRMFQVGMFLIRRHFMETPYLFVPDNPAMRLCRFF